MVGIWIGVTVVFGYWFTFTGLLSYKLLVMGFVGVVCIRLYGVVSVY